jgi:hypothetical protein
MLIWLGAVAMACGVLFGVTILYRPWEFEDIDSLPTEVRLDLTRDFEPAIAREFVPYCEKGEPSLMSARWSIRGKSTPGTVTVNVKGDRSIRCRSYIHL